MKYDEYDKGILKILYEDSKVSNSTLAQKINLSPPATLERVRKLRANGIIQGQKAILDKKKLGRGLTCFLALQIKQLQEIEEIYFLTGRIDYLIQANFRDIDEFREFFIAKLSIVQMIEPAESFVVVSSAVNPRYNPINVDVKDQDLD